MFEYIDKKVKVRRENETGRQSHIKEIDIQKNTKCIMLKSDREIIQKIPIPVNAENIGVGAMFCDSENRNIRFKKIAENTYLYDEEKILIWDESNQRYLNSSYEIEDINLLVPARHHTVVVAMGEMGEITGRENKIMTSYASPCLILVIQNRRSIKMAHIFCGNSEASIDEIIRSLTPVDRVTLATEVDEAEDADKDEQGEYYIQKQRRIKLNRILNDMKKKRQIASYDYYEDMQNATASFADSVIKHPDNSEPEDLSKLAFARTNQMNDLGGISIVKRPADSNIDVNDIYDF